MVRRSDFMVAPDLASTTAWDEAATEIGPDRSSEQRPDHDLWL
jgi:hypothetical protein